MIRNLDRKFKSEHPTSRELIMIIRIATKPSFPFFHLIEEVETTEVKIWFISELSDEANIITDCIYEKVKYIAKDDYVNRYFDFNVT